MKPMDSFTLINFLKEVFFGGSLQGLSHLSVSTADSDFALGLVRELAGSLFKDKVMRFKDSGLPGKGKMG